MSFLDNITEYLTDEDRQLSSKAAFIVLIILVVVFVDNVLGFSYHFRIDKKLDEIQKINTIIKDPTVDSTTKAYAIQLRADIMQKQTVIDYTLSFFRNIKWASSKKPQINKPTPIPKPIESATRNNFIFLLTSGGFYFLIAIIGLPVLAFAPNQKTSLPQRLATGILIAFVFSAIGVFFYWLFDFIPLLSKKTWTWNYILNSFFQIAIIVAVAIISKPKK